MQRIAIFASGSGSNFEAIVSACEEGRIAAQVALVVCDRPGAGVCDRAARHGVELFVFSPCDYKSKRDFEAQIIDRLNAAGVSLVCLAGYMRIIGDDLLAAYGGRIINIHPSLLPAFSGAKAIQQAMDYGVKVFGVTIHWVDQTLDGGRIISQRAFEYLGDDLQELETIVHKIEHPLYIETIQKILENESTN